MTKQTRLDEILKNDPGVKESYPHAPKRVTPGGSVETNGAVLKWYQLAADDRKVPNEIDRLARSYLARTGANVRSHERYLRSSFVSSFSTFLTLSHTRYCSG